MTFASPAGARRPGRASPSSLPVGGPAPSARPSGSAPAGAPERDGQIPELDDESATTSELLQAHLADARVVKGFNNIYVEHLAILSRRQGAADRTALPIAGDDPAAKEAVTQFLDAIGYDTVDVGPLAQGWRTHRDAPVYVHPYGTFSEPVGTPADAETVPEALQRPYTCDGEPDGRGMVPVDRRASTAATGLRVVTSASSR